MPMNNTLEESIVLGCHGNLPELEGRVALFALFALFALLRAEVKDESSKRKLELEHYENLRIGYKERRIYHKRRQRSYLVTLFLLLV